MENKQHRKEGWHWYRTNGDLILVLAAVWNTEQDWSRYLKLDPEDEAWLDEINGRIAIPHATFTFKHVLSFHSSSGSVMTLDYSYWLAMYQYIHSLYLDTRNIHLLPNNVTLLKPITPASLLSSPPPPTHTLSLFLSRSISLSPPPPPLSLSLSLSLSLFNCRLQFSRTTPLIPILDRVGPPLASQPVPWW